MTITAELHDGTRLEFPDGTDSAVIQQTVKKVLGGQVAQPTPASVSVGASLRDVPRQVGLTARYGIEGLGNLLDVGAAPIRVAVNPLLRAVGLPGAATVGAGASALADMIGLPSPQNADERTVGEAARLMAGSGGGAAIAARGAAAAAPGVVRNVLTSLAANPGAQIAGGAGAGLAGGSVREAGGGPVEQLIASIAGGVAGGVGANALANLATSAGRKIVQALTPRSVELQRADQQISLVLDRAGIDWSAVPERIKQGMRQEVADALNTGQPLSPDALRRLLVFRRAGVTPTVGQLTQDPGMITREKNLAKSGANSTNPSLQSLPNLENANVNAILQQLDQMGAARGPDAVATGSTLVGGLSGQVQARRGGIDALYAAARDTQGRSLPLEGGTFTRRANELLDQEMVGGALPEDVAIKMNRIANGEMPFTVEIAEQLKTRIGNLQRNSSDGNARMALGLVRQALDEAPLVSADRVNPRNLPAVAGTVPPSPVVAGKEAIDAFNAARSANRAYMQTLEANPALAAVDEALAAVRSNRRLGTVQDVAGAGDFVKRFVTSRAASPREVQDLVGMVGPDGAQALRQYFARYLKDAATASTDDIAKFSNTAYRKALRDFGDEKLRALFSPDEIDQIKALGEAAKYMQAQPAGSAVNNSNSGALVIGRGLDMLERIAEKAPIGRDAITGLIQGFQQRQVLAPQNALLKLGEKPAPARLSPLLAAIAATGPSRNDDRGNKPP